jgi:hypothetical protein
VIDTEDRRCRSHNAAPCRARKRRGTPCASRWCRRRPEGRTACRRAAATPGRSRDTGSRTRGARMPRGT